MPKDSTHFSLLKRSETLMRLKRTIPHPMLFGGGRWAEARNNVYVFLELYLMLFFVAMRGSMYQLRSTRGSMVPVFSSCGRQKISPIRVRAKIHYSGVALKVVDFHFVFPI